MADAAIALNIRAYDYHAPLLLGDVATPGVDLKTNHRFTLSMDFPEGVDAAEISFNRYTLSHARGAPQLVGIPAFVLRGFRHRNYLVRRDSPLESLADLRGKRVGTAAWSDSGTLWARAALREAGVAIADVRWILGDVDEKERMTPPSPANIPPPQGATILPAGETLLDGLRKGTVDAVTTAFMPHSLFRPDCEFRRLVRDYRAAERGYHKRTGIYPAFHIIGVKREAAEHNPKAVIAIYRALQESWAIWWRKGKDFGEATPWAMEEYETMARDFSDDMPPFGLESAPHQRMIKGICEEQIAQGLVATAAKPEDLFAEFERIRAAVN